MSRQTYAHQLERARLILSAAATDPELQARLAAVGYDAAAMQAGQSLYDAATTARTASHDTHADQLASTDAVSALRDEAEAHYRALAQIARTLFEGNTAALEALGLRMGQRATPATVPTDAASGDPATEDRTTERRSESQAAFLDRARLLYDGALANPELVAMLEPIGYPRVRLQQERADIHRLEQADVQQESEKAEARAGSASQRAALEALQDWVSRFNGIVKVSLRDRPDLLGKLGLRS